MKKKAVIIGAGPAGLSAAYELLTRTDYDVFVFEENCFVGGISATHNYKNNKIDLGGHRFFTKCNRVMNWWIKFLPIQTSPSIDDILLERIPPSLIEVSSSDLRGEMKFDPELNDNVMLSRSRVSRIYYNKTFFDYPISLSFNTICGLGIFQMVRILLSYFGSMFNRRKECSLEDFFINRFGRRLYEIFFKDYTEKLWGIRCADISAEWGAQRVKGISIVAIVKDILFKLLGKKGSNETSLIDAFYYPKFGPGHLWQEVAKQVELKGGIIEKGAKVVKFICDNDNVKAISWKNADGVERTVELDVLISTMPIKDLIKAMGEKVPEDVKKIADGLVYRDFRTVGVLVNKLKIKNNTKRKVLHDLVPDTWIYVQEKNIRMGRIQVFNNWSPYMVNDFEKTVWLGCEYFCSENDDLWMMPDENFEILAKSELVKMGIIDKDDILDACSFKVKKAYPAYFGSYKDFGVIRNFLDVFNNLYLIGRNGTHRYNNMDHSVLSAMIAVDNIVEGRADKSNIWSVNTEKEYHEEK